MRRQLLAGKTDPCVAKRTRSYADCPEASGWVDFCLICVPACTVLSLMKLANPKPFVLKAAWACGPLKVSLTEVHSDENDL